MSPGPLVEFEIGKLTAARDETSRMTNGPEGSNVGASLQSKAVLLLPLTDADANFAVGENRRASLQSGRLPNETRTLLSDHAVL